MCRCELPHGDVASGFRGKGVYRLARVVNNRFVSEINRSGVIAVWERTRHQAQGTSVSVALI